MSNISFIVEQLKRYAEKNRQFIDVQHGHFAAIFIEKKRQILSYGTNQIRNGKSIHAEMDAINNLPPNPKRNRLRRVSLIVIRLSKGCTCIGNSKCCIKCCETVYRIPPLRGYTIDSVYYSNSKGRIEEHHPISLLLEETYHRSVFFTRRGYKPRLPDRIRSSPTMKESLFIAKV